MSFLDSAWCSGFVRKVKAVEDFENDWEAQFAILSAFDCNAISYD